MKVEIESVLQNFNTPSQNYEFWDIVKQANISKTLAEFRYELSTKDINSFVYGFGSNHCWVKQIDFRNGKPFENRLLFITE